MNSENSYKHKKLYIKILILFVAIIIFFIIAMLLVINSGNSEVLSNKEKLIISNTLSTDENFNTDKNISNDISKITAINYDSDSNNPTTYIVVEPEKIDKIIKLFSNSKWSLSDTPLTDTYHYSWYIKMEGNIEAEFFMYGVPVVKVKMNEEEKTYEINEMDYKEILATFNTRYYLHKSDIEKPEEDDILNFREQIFKDLNDEEITEIQDTLRLTHMNLEQQLLESINTIKDSASPYWEQANYGGEFTDPLTNVKTDHGNYCFNTILKNLEKIKNTIKDEKTKIEFENIIKLLKSSMDNHDLSGCFKAHEFIHDYDYFVINYPVYFPTFAPPDWEGINVYFGHLNLD